MKKIIFLILLLPTLLFSQDLSYLKLQDVSGNEFVFKNNLENDATLVLFWATWCLPCKKEFPAVQSVIEKYEKKNIKIIAISQDSPRSMAKVKSFVKSHKYDFTYLLDPNGEISSKLLVNSVPYTMLLNKEGKVIYSHSGYRKGDENELEKELQKYWKKLIAGDPE